MSNNRYFSGGCIVPQEESQNLFIILFYPGLCTFILGFLRVGAMLYFFLNNVRNRLLLRKMDKETHSFEYNSLIKTLILPTYYPFVQLIILSDLIFGIIDIVFAVLYTNNIDNGHLKSSKIFYWIFPLQFGLFHAIAEGIAYFYTKSGAGAESLFSVLKFSGVWFVVTAALCYLMIWLSTPVLLTTTSSEKASFSIAFVIDFCLLIMYIYMAYSPDMKLLHYLCGNRSTTTLRRPALITYAKYNIFLCSYWCFFGALNLFAADKKNVQCVTQYGGIITIGLLQPFFIWRSLVTDSNYWQGYFDNSNLIVADMDKVSVATAASISENLSVYETDKRSLPLLHFGLIDINENLKFVAGGVSRIYFGKFKEKQVAIKLMYLMEFNPSDIKNFFAEATVLHTLKSPRIVECFGVCVMPPAVTMVLEFCTFGSLFDFLHKEGWKSDKDKESKSRDSSGGPLQFFRNSLSQTFRNSLTSIESSRGGGGVVVGSFSSEDVLISQGSEFHHNPMNPSKAMKLATFNNNESNSVQRDSSGGSASKRRTNSVGKQQKHGDTTESSGIHPAFLCQMAVDAVDAVSFIHSQGFIHCDLKSLNFLVTDGYRIKLTDFGEARHIADKPKRLQPPIAALNWAPPEVLHEQSDAYSYTMKSDIFGLAIVVNEILSIQIPFATQCIGQTYIMWYEKLTKDNLRPYLAEDMPPQLKKALCVAWSSDPSNRCLSHDILVVLNSQSVSDFYSRKIISPGDIGA